MYHVRPVLDGDQFVHAVASGAGILGWFPKRDDAERVAELLEAVDSPMPEGEAPAAE